VEGARVFISGRRAKELDDAAVLLASQDSTLVSGADLFVGGGTAQV
jgi:hypothetical protein